MKKLYFILISIVVLSIGQTYAQYAADAVRFSQTIFGGSARYQAIGGASYALGGDIGSLSGNPAGIGLYTRSDFSLSGLYVSNNVDANYLNTLNRTNKDNINLINGGFVITEDIFNARNWKSVTFGVGVNQSSNFTNNTTFSGFNPNNSITRFFAESANRFGLGSGSLEEMAFDGFLINPNQSNTAFVPASNGNVNQLEQDITRGGITEVNIAGAANLDDRFYIGLSINFVNLNYKKSSFYTETGINDPQFNVTALELDENQEVVGNGAKAVLGVIFRPIDAVRIGFGIETPTFYELTETFDFRLSSFFDDGTNPIIPARETSFFDYKIRTPFKLNAGVAFFLKDAGFLSVDVEQVNYRRIGFESDFATTNVTTKNRLLNDYRTAYNVRLGAEARLGLVNLRAGYAMYGSPLNVPNADDLNKTILSGGIGYRINDIYLDFALVNTTSESSFSPYLLDNFTEPTAFLKNSRTNGILTVGVRF